MPKQPWHTVISFTWPTYPAVPLSTRGTPAATHSLFTCRLASMLSRPFSTRSKPLKKSSPNRASLMFACKHRQTCALTAAAQPSRAHWSRHAQSMAILMIASSRHVAATAGSGCHSSKHVASGVTPCCHTIRIFCPVQQRYCSGTTVVLQLYPTCTTAALYHMHCLTMYLSCDAAAPALHAVPLCTALLCYQRA